MTKFKCPLCHSDRHIEVDKTGSPEVIRNFKKMYNVEVEKFFPEKEFRTLKCADCGLQAHHPALPGDSGFYDEMQMHSFYYEGDKPEFSYALDKILEKKPGKILEIGCGEGLFLRKIDNAFDVAGSEYSEKSISKLKKAGIRLDEPDDKYDFVMSFQVLEHVQDVKGFIEHAIDKLNDNGYLLITVPNNDSKYIQEGNSPLDYPPHHLTQWPKKALESISLFPGLEIEDYYIEPIRIEHLQGLIWTRRNKLAGGSLTKKIMSKIGRLTDKVLLPYHIDKISMPGHTHGIFLKKKGSQTD